METFMSSFYDAAKSAMKQRKVKALKRIVGAAYKFYKSGKMAEAQFVKFQGWVYRSQAMVYKALANELVGRESELEREIELTPPVQRTSNLTMTLAEMCPALETLAKSLK